MAEILIRGLSIPKEGFINLSVQSEGLTMLTATSTFNEKTGWFEWQKCDHTMHETIELPEHGDLIDRDAFREENEYYLHREFINPKYEDTLDDLLKDAPVIVPSNKEETE